MRSPGPGRSRRGRACVLGLLACLGAAPASAIEFFDGRVQIHGYGETQIRSIAQDFDLRQWDLTQWYLIGNLEVEVDIAPDGFGPIDLMGAYARLEGRYDCLWTSACGLFPSVDTYGDQSRRLPKRLSDGRKNVFRGTLFPSEVRIDSAGTLYDFSDRRPYHTIPRGQDGAAFAVPDPEGDPAVDIARPVPGRRNTGRLWDVPGLGQLFFGLPGLDPNGVVDVEGTIVPITDPGLGDDDISGCIPGHDPAALPCRYSGAYVTQRYLGYRFGIAKVRGPFGGIGTRIMGPWRPKDDIGAVATLRDRVNPYDMDTLHPVMVDTDGNPLAGAGDLPFRPQTRFAADANGDGVVDAADEVGLLVSRGLYYPSSQLASALRDEDFRQPKVNFNERELAFNQGDAQQHEYGVKEAYLDIELLDHALWVRAGKQTIVWGKTELFRSQDQFNPQDLGLSSLPSLEESRIALWGLRAIYSFYDVGPFADVRLEGAVLIDDFQPLDFGRCGEPYAPPQACLLASGLFAHGLLGLGLAGEYQPDPPWDDPGDVEGGLRLEWRWNRWSFALTEWVGYPDIPHVEILQPWERNVDPDSGRPRRAGASGPCVEGTEPSCFAGGVGTGDIRYDEFYPGLATPDTDDVLANHHANQQLFATICASTLDISNLRPQACAFNVWNSQQYVENEQLEGITNVTLAQAFSAMLQGHGFAEAARFNGKAFLVGLARWTTDGDEFFPGDLGPGARMDENRVPLVPLHVNSNLPPGLDPNDPANMGPRAPKIDGYQVFARTTIAFPDVCPGATPPEALEVCAPGPLPGTGLRPGAINRLGLSPALTDQQESLVGCGIYWGTDCDIFGFDLLNSEASALTQSWPGFEGAGGLDWDPFDGYVAQPGTIHFRGGPPCTRFDPASKSTRVLPGCRGAQDVMLEVDPITGDETVVAIYEPGWSLEVDGCIFADQIGGVPVVGRYPDGSPADVSNCTAGPDQIIRTQYHPYAGCLIGDEEAMGKSCRFDLSQDFVERDYDAEFLAYLRGEPGARPVQVFHSEMASLSWNLLMVLVASSTPPDVDPTNTDCPHPASDPDNTLCADRPPRWDEFDVNDPERLDGCSFRRPFLCRSAGSLFATTGARRNTVRAGGNGRYGRRDFLWHSGAVAVLDYKRRNVLGFSMDFPEDVTKTNWGVEFTWFDRVLREDNDELDGLTETQLFNLSVSVDRPTFIRFLNAGRTFLFNGQVFFQYVENYKKSMPTNGPLNVLATLFAATAYHQDRLIPSLTLAHDFNSVSGAAIASLTYRYSTHFSVGVGAAAFYGRTESVVAPITGIAGPGGGAGEGAYHAYVENGLSSIRDRDELFLRFRYTF